MKDEWTPPAKMEHIKQNENDCGARIISSQQKGLYVLPGVEM